MANKRYTIQELADETGTDVQTLRYWMRRKVLARPYGSGRAAYYDRRHIAAARVIQHLRAAAEPLRAIRARLVGQSEAQLLAMLPRAPQGEVPPPPQEPSYPAVSWEVINLMEGLVLMVNSTSGAVLRRVADDIFRHYGATAPAPAAR